MEGVYSQYVAWCGRYSATFITDVLYKIWDTDQSWYFLWPLFSFLILAGGVYAFISAVLYQFKAQLKRSEKILCSILFVCLLFFLSVDIGETWLWYCSISSYLWSVAGFFWGCALLLGNYNRIISILLSSFCFIYVGGASEVYSVIYGVMILAFLVYRYKKQENFNAFLRDPLNSKIIIAYGVFGIAFLIFLVAPGNYLRDELFPEHHIGNALFITAKSIVKFGVLYLPFRLIYILAFAFPFIVIGSGFSGQYSGIPFRLFFKRLTIALLSFLLLFFLIVAYVMVETGPPRLWFMVAFLFAVYCAVLCFYAGFSGLISEGKIAVLKKGHILIAFLILGYNLANQFQLCRNYAAAHDERIAHIEALSKTISSDTLIVLPDLPSSGMLYSSEIKADTNHFTNRELRLAFDLKFHVISTKK